FVIVRPARQHQHLGCAEAAGDEQPGMAGHAVARKTGGLGIWDAHAILHLVDETAETRAEHQCGAGRSPFQPLDDPRYGFIHFNVSPAKPSGRISAMVRVWTIPVSSQR